MMFTEVKEAESARGKFENATLKVKKLLFDRR